MEDFVNTIDILDDEAVMNSILDATITEFADDKLEKIRSGCFAGCSELTSVILPNVTFVMGLAFKDCTSLELVEMPSVTSFGITGTPTGTETFCNCSKLTEVVFPSLTTVSLSAFLKCASLRKADFPAVSQIDSRAFVGCTSLQALILRNESALVTLDSGAFEYTGLTPCAIATGTGYIYVPSSLVLSYLSATNWSTYAGQFRSILEEDIEATNAIIDGTLVDYENNTIEYIPPFAFNGYQELKSLRSTSALKIGDKSFKGCSALEEVDLPNVTELGTGFYPGESFRGCTSLRSVSLPSLTKIIGRSSFFGCKNLKEISLPNLTNMGSYTFDQTGLVNIELPKVTTIGPGTFRNCSSLEMVDLHVATSIQAPFEYCTSLKALIIRTPTMCTSEYSYGLPPTVTTGGTGYIYVPKALIEDYKVAANWSTYATQFRALEDYTIDGTTTGKLDESKI